MWLGSQLGIVLGGIGGAVCADAVGVTDGAGAFGIFLGFCSLHAHGIDGSSGQATLHLDQHGGLGERFAGFLGSLMQHQHANIAGNGIEATGVHDPGTGLLGGGVEFGDRAVHEQHLTAQVHVVSTGLGTRTHQLIAVAGVRTHGGDDGRGLLGQVVQGGRIKRIGDDDRPLADGLHAGVLSDLAAHLL